MDGAAEDRAARLRRWATYASVAMASTLIVAKLVAYMMTESVSILSSLIDSSTDLMASLVTLFGVRHALRPADRSHRFGHGKAEALAALAQAAFIAGSAALLSIEAVRRLFSPAAVGATGVGVAVMLLSIVLTVALVSFQRYVVRRTGSIAIGADRLHYTGDVMMNGAVITALLVTRYTGIGIIDALFGIGISAFLLRGAWTIAHDALAVLMDRELPEAERERITALVLAHGEARGMHDLRTRSAGTGVFIELHLELDPHLTVVAAHDITDAIERELRSAFDNAEVLIHQEPAGLKDERLDHRIHGER